MLMFWLQLILDFSLQIQKKNMILDSQGSIIMILANIL